MNLANVMRREALRAMSGQVSVRTGIVSDYDEATHTARVRIGADMDASDYWETGWIPIATPWVGDQWGVFAPCSPGDQVVVAFDDQDRTAGAVVGGIFSDEQRALSVPAGEFHIVHSSGSFLKFKANGHVELTVAGNLDLAVTGDITSSANSWAHTGDVTVTGTVTGTTVKQGSVVLGSHVHSGVQSGGSTTGGPQ